jgi:hypothetical protein
VVIVALALVLSQAPPPPSAEAEIERARVLITDLYEEKALAVLKPLLADPSKLAPELLGRAHVYAGIAYYDLADEVKARESFRAALKADPGAVLPGWASRRIRAVFDAELAAVPKPAEKPAVLDLQKIVVVSKEKPGRKIWLGVALGAGALATGIGAGLTFPEIGSSYARARAEPESWAANGLNQDVVRWNDITIALGALSAALLIGLVVWIINP